MLILELSARSSQQKAQVSGNCPSQHTVFGELQHNLHLLGQILQTPNYYNYEIGRIGELYH